MNVYVSKRNGWIELCRFIFALCVVCSHAQFLSNPGHIPLSGGYIAVEFFFILTGFFLCKSAEKKPFENGGMSEALKRLKTIFPYFLTSWMASFVISHVYYQIIDFRVVLRDFIRGIPQLLFLSMPGLGGGTDGLWDYVGTGWYISAMFVAILVVYPFIRHFGREFSSTVSFVVAIMLYGNIVMNYNFIGVVNEWTGNCQYGIVRAVAGICLGCFSYYVASAIQEKDLKLSAIGNYLVSGIQILIVIMILYLMEDYSGFEDVIKVILFTFLIILSFAFDTGVNKICSNRICDFLGKFSTVVFVTQSVTYMYPFLKYPENWNERFMCHILYIMLFSIVNYVFIEILKKVANKVKIEYILFYKG